jgi:Mrp family chromosome partitioning ATPase/capsular polysaccharide biosynthesis protein
MAGALWRYRWAVLGVTILSATAGYVYAARQPLVYEATTQIKLANPYTLTLFRQQRGVAFTDIDRYVNVQADRVKSPSVMSRASEALQGELSAGQIRQAVSATAVPDVLDIVISSRSGNPREAAAVANAVAQAYQDVSLDEIQARVDASVAELETVQADLRQRLLDLPASAEDRRVRAERDGLSQELADLQTASAQIRADAAVYGAGIDDVVIAAPPEVPVSDSPRRLAAIWGVLGFLVALIAAFWRSERVHSVERDSDVPPVLGLTHLGTLAGRSTDPATPTAAAFVVSAPGSRAAVAHQFVATRLAVMDRDNEPRVLLVTSPGAATGKSVTALNLGLASAMNQREVVLADLDASSELTRMLEADQMCGVSDLLARTESDGDFTLDDCVAKVPGLSPSPYFRFIAAGSDEHAAPSAATSGQLSKLLDRLLQESDLVLLDGPPLLQTPDAMRLAAAVDGVVLVVPRRTSMQSLHDATRLLDTAGAVVLGYVFDPTVQTRWRRTVTRLRYRRRSRHA